MLRNDTGRSFRDNLKSGGFLVPIIKFAIGIPGAVAQAGTIVLASTTPLSIGAAAAISKAAVTFGLLAGVSAVSKAIRKKPDLTSLQSQGILITHRGSAEPARIIYGRVRTGGVLYPIGTTGETNEFYHFVICWAGHEVDAIESIWFNEEEIAIDGSGNPTGRFKDFVRIKHHTGSTTQAADSDLVSEITRWTNSHQGKGIAYTYFRFKWNQDLFAQDYNITAIIRGKKTYSAVSDTTDYRDNAIRALNDYLTEPDIVGIDIDRATEVDDTQFTAAENDCNEVVSYYPTATCTFDTTNDEVDAVAHGLEDGDGVTFTTTGSLPTSSPQIVVDEVYYVYNKTDDDFEIVTAPWSTTKITFSAAGSGNTFAKAEYRYTVNGVILSSERPRDVIPQLLAACGGTMVYVGGQYFYHAGVSQTATVTLDEDDLRGPISIQSMLAGNDIFNTVRGLYVSRKHNYNATDFPIFRRWAEQSFGTGDVDTGADTIAYTAHPFDTDDIIRFRLDKAASSTLPSPLAEDTDYYVHSSSTTNAVAVSTTAGGSAVNITTIGSGTNYFRYENYLRDDNWERLYRDISLRFTNSELMAERIARIMLERSRQEITVTMPSRMQGFKLRAFDVVNITNTRMGWSSKLFEVADWALEIYEASRNGESIPMLGTRLVLRETAAAVWSFDKDVDQTDQDLAPNTNLPDPGTVQTPQNPTISSGANDGFFGDDGSWFSRIRIGWDRSTDHFVLSGGLVEIQWRKRDTQDFTVTVATDKVNITAHGIPNGREVRTITDGTLPDPLEVDTSYYVINAGTNDLELSTERGGSKINITNTGSGTHSLVYQDFIKHFIDGDSVEHIFTHVVEGEIYDVRWRFVNSLGVKGSFVTDNDHTVTGESAAPSAPTGLSAGDMGSPVAIAKWTFPTDTDLAGVEVQTRTDAIDPWDDVGFVAGSGQAGSSNKGFFTEAVQSGETWRVRVRSVDRKGNPSSYTSETTHTMP